MIMNYIYRFFIIISLLLFTFTISYSHQLDGKEKTVLDILEIYNQDFSGISISLSKRAEIMQSRGSNLQQLSNEILSDPVYSYYWSDAIWMLAVHHKEDRNLLLNEVFKYILRQENICSKEVLNFKISALIILQELLSYKSFDNETFKNNVCERLCPFYRDEDPTNPEFWLGRIGLHNHLISDNNLDSNNNYKEINIQSIVAAESCIYTAAKLYHLTENKRFLDLVKKGQKSEHLRIKIASNFALSVGWMDNWKKGVFDLFYDFEKVPVPTDSKYEYINTRKLQLDREKKR